MMIGTLRRLLGGGAARTKPSEDEPLTIRHAAASDAGRVRLQNEDRWYADTHQQLFIVSDGMGGQAAGEVASRIVVEILPERLRSKLEHADQLDEDVVSCILETVRGLSSEVRQESTGEPGLVGMGATLVLVLIRGRQALIVHLGDSRVYLIRNGELACLTSDHTLAHALLNAGVLTAEEAFEHPGRHQLSRFVGMPGEPLPEARLLDLLSTDRLLLCSDGLTSMLTDGQIGAAIGAHADANQVCKTLIEMASAAGGKDDITTLLLEFA